jgi:glycerol kinase
MGGPGDEADLAWLAGELSAIRRELLPAGEDRALTLALDQGGNSSRAVLFDAVGRQVASAHVPIATRRDGEFVEHDPEELVQSLLTAARDACESPLAVGRPVNAAGLATQRSTVCCWDRNDGAALSAAISWQDRRHGRWLDATLGARAGWVRELTGLPLSPHYGASKLRWCLEELPAVRLALRDERLAMGPLASFLVHRLCRERPVLADPANASRTLLFDPAILDWSLPLLEAFEIPRAVLPRCVGTVHDYGTLSIEGRGEVPLRACSGDQSAALFAFGPPAADTAYVNVGTGAFVQRIVPAEVAPLPRGLLKSVVYAHTDDVQGALYCHEGTVNGAYAAVDWLRGRIALDVARALATITTAQPPAKTSTLFMNGVGGLGAPFWLPHFPTEFVLPDGRTAPAGAVPELEQLAAVLDSIAFLVAANVAVMQRVAPLQRIVISGGLAACDYLCEVIAEATGLPVDRPELHEASARGIAYLAAGQPLQWQDVEVEKTFRPTDSCLVCDRFERWREAMAQRGAVT